MFLSIYYIRIYRGQLLSYVTVYKEDNGAEADVNVSPFEKDEIKRGEKRWVLYSFAADATNRGFCRTQYALDRVEHNEFGFDLFYYYYYSLM